MYYNSESKVSFGTWIKAHDWTSVKSQTSSNDKAKVCQDTVMAAMREHFPTVITRRKSTELPWINDWVR